MPTPRTDHLATPRAPARPFVGRQAELDEMRRHLGRPGAVLVSGDPGIGKTRLAEEFAAEAEASGAAVYWGRAWEGDGAPAFWPWIQIAREIEETTTGASQVLADLQGDRRDETDDAAGLDVAPARFRLFDAVTRLLVDVAAARPVVLVLEDLHWADAPSILLLRFLVRHARSAPVLALATYRDAELAKDDSTRAALASLLRHGTPLALGGLAASEVAQYVAATLGDARARTLADRLHRETDGHPFFLAEMVRLLQGGSAPALAGIPDGIRALIARRLEQRSPACRRLLHVAAVVGRDFASSLLRRLPALAGEDVAARLAEAVDARLLTTTPDEPDLHRFAHALVRDAAYAELALEERVTLHREIGEAIAAAAGSEADAEAAALAHHFREAAADGDVATAVHWGLRAGDRAVQALAYEEAVAHYERTLRLLERQSPVDEAERCPLLIALGLAQVRAGDPSAAAAAFGRAAALARRHGSPEDLARAALGIGEIERQSERVVPLLEEALAALHPGDGVLRARLLARLAVALYWSQPEARKRALSDEAVAMARRLGYVPTLAFALSGRIAALSGPDDVAARLAAAREMVALADRCGNRELAMIGHGWTVADCLSLGDVHQAGWAIDAFATLAEESRHPYFAWWLGAIRTMQALLQARFTDAASLAQACFARGQRTVAVDAAQVFAGHQFAVCVEGEHHDELEPLIRAAVAQFPNVPSGRAGLALLHADRGRVHEAALELETLAADRFAAVPRNPEWLTTIAVLAQTSALLPEAPHAAALFDLLAPYRARVIVAGMGVFLAGSTAHFLGILAMRLGRLAVAEECFVEALAMHERLGAVVMRAYTRYEHARLALARGGSEAEALAARLAAEARRDADGHDMRRLQRLLAELPVPSTHALPVQPIAAPQARASVRATVLRREGDYWRVGWEQGEFRLRDRIGLHYLAALIASPAREILAVDLVRTTGGRRRATPSEDPDLAALATDVGRPRQLASAEAAPDRRAEHAYRERLRELRGLLEEARRRHDLGRIAGLERETDALTREIARGLGLHGHDRDSRSPIERARISATRAIRVAIRLIQDNDRALGRHLAITVKTGTFCSYVPDPELPVAWRL